MAKAYFDHPVRQRGFPEWQSVLPRTVLVFIALTVSYLAYNWNGQRKQFERQPVADFVPLNQLHSDLFPTFQNTLAFDENFYSELPLRTQSRWIINRNGRRVKLACINWASHMETMLPEGLAQRSIGNTTRLIRRLGFNCVRFPFASQMFKSGNKTLHDLIQKYMSQRTAERFWARNPQLEPNMTVLSVFRKTVEAMRDAQLMVILDNHMTNATWCCGLFDGNRWWNQRYFHVDDWLRALQSAASFARPYPHIIGIGLRNEPHTVKPLGGIDWFRYMRLGALAVHEVNPNVLITVSGQSSSSYLSSIRSIPFLPASAPPSLREKIVFEAHFYNLIYIHGLWNRFPDSWVCGYMHSFLESRVGFVMDEGHPYTAPLWFSEFGLDTTRYKSTNEKDPDTKWLTCLMQWMKKRDVDWAYWQLNSRYYIRQGHQDYKENWSILADTDKNASVIMDEEVQNPELLAQLTLLMQPTKGPAEVTPGAA